MSGDEMMAGIYGRWLVDVVGSRGREAFHNWSYRGQFPTHHVGCPGREVQARWSLARSSTIADSNSRQWLHVRTM